MHPIFAGVNPERLTLIDILRWRAQHEPQQEAYAFLLDGETKKAQMTYADLDLQARRIATLLLDCVATGERVLLLYPPGLEYITAIFGCFYAGVVAVPAYPPRPNQHHQRIQIIVQDAQVTAVLTTSKICLSLQRAGTLLQDLEWIVTDTSNQQAGMPPSPSSPQALALLQYTSGSTSSPKGVMLTHRNLVQNAALIQEGMSLTSDDRGMVWLPPYHDMGLMAGILQAVYTGYSMVLMAPATFLQQPLRWLQALSSLRITASGGPNFAYDLCVRSATQEIIKTLDLSSWTLAFTGAEPVRAETLARFAETFAPCGFRPEAFYPCYGLAEATLFVSGGHRQESPHIRAFDGQTLERGHVVEATEDQNASRLLVGCGHERPGQEVAIVDPQLHTRCAPGTIGEIWVRGPQVAQGYWGKVEETAETFQAFLREERERHVGTGVALTCHTLSDAGNPCPCSPATQLGPFLRTGDLGFCVDSELFVTSRLKDLIIIRGRNLYPQDIERVVEKSHPLLRQSCCAVFAVEGASSEQVVIVQEVVRHYNDQGMQEAIEAICQAVLSAFDVEVAAIELLRAGTIPKTTSGKIQRYACRSGFLAGELNAVYRWNRIHVGTGVLPTYHSQHQNEKPLSAPAHHALLGQGEPLSSKIPTHEGESSPVPTVQEIVDWLVLHIAQRMHIDTHAVDLRAPFVQFGLNSLEAIGLSGELEQWLGRSLSPTLIYDYPSIDALAHHLAGASRPQGARRTGASPVPTDADADRYQPVETNVGADKHHARQTDAIAIIGLGCRFPGADNPEVFWQMLHDGIDAISEVPATRWDATQFYAPDQATPGKMNTRWGGFLPHIELFDPSFFHISLCEARHMDPQQRLLLEVAWETLENAGQAPDKLAGSQTGVFIGISSNDYAHLHLKNAQLGDAYVGTGNAHSIAANRLSYTLDLRGPSMAIDTACSSSLVAVHQACQSLRNGECDLALAGGVNVLLSPELTITFSQARMMSSTGRCKAFDEAADGYVRGEGCGLILLKPLAAAERDGDKILAIIRGSAVNQDGRSNGLTAPNGPSQEVVIRHALSNAGVSPSEISYVETHGSSTPLGDPIEVDALKAVLMQERSPDRPCLLGAVKTNIGHLEAAAGIAGLIKTVLCLQKGVIAPNLHFNRLNPHISFVGTTFEIPTKPSQWPGQSHAQRFAGVSAFGFGGTNAHIILECAPQPTNHNRRDIALSPLGERSVHFEREYCWFESEESNKTSVGTGLAPVRCEPVAPVFAGSERTGASPVPTFATSQIDFGLIFFSSHETSVNGEIYRQVIESVRYADQHGFSSVWIPERHFTKEGWLYPNPAILLTALARETSRIHLRAGSVVVPLHHPLRIAEDWAMVDHLSGGRLGVSFASGWHPNDFALAPENYTDRSAVMYRNIEAVRKLWRGETVLFKGGDGQLVELKTSPLPLQHDIPIWLTAAGNPATFAKAGQLGANLLTHMYNQSVDELAEKIRIYRNARAEHGHDPATGKVSVMIHTYIGADRETVRAQVQGPFSNYLKSASSLVSAIAYSRGQQADLSALSEQELGDYLAFVTDRMIDEQRVLFGTPEMCAPLVTQLQAAGVDEIACQMDFGIDTDLVLKSLPYLNQLRELCNRTLETGRRQDPLQETALHAGHNIPTGTQNEIKKWLYQLHWEAVDLPKPMASISPGHWLVFLDHKGIGQHLSTQLQEQGHVCTLIEAGQNFQMLHQHHYQVNPANPQEIKQAVGAALAAVRMLPLHGVLHLWSLDTTPAEALNLATLESDQILGVQSALSLIQALVEEAVQTRLWFITQGAQPIVATDTELAVSQAPLWGLGKTCAMEQPEIWGGLIDLDPNTIGGGALRGRSSENSGAPFSSLSLSRRHGPYFREHSESGPDEPARELAGTGRGFSCGKGSDGRGKPLSLRGSVSFPNTPTPEEEDEAVPLLSVLQGDWQEDQIALRGTKIHVARMVRVETDVLQESRALRLMPDASYLITGGLWGLGLEVARWLATRGARHLILLGRSKLPPRETWEQVPPESRQGMQIAGIRAIERLGAEVHAASVDVTDKAQLAAFFEQYQQQGMPPLRGIIHAASVWRDAQGQSLLKPLSNLEVADLMTVLRPKLLGGWCLTTVFEEAQLDFFVSFSSIASLFGSGAMGNYAAANEFLGVLAHYQRAQGQPGICLDWGSIAGMGIGATPEGRLLHEYWASHGIGLLSSQQFTTALELLLPQDLARVGVLRLNWQRLVQSYPRIANLPLVRHFVKGQPVIQGTQAEPDRVNALIRRATPNANVADGTSVLQTLREAHEEEHHTILSTYMQELIATVLRIPVQRLETEQPLTSLGFDSLMAIELKNRMDLDLQIHLPIVTLLQGLSITQLVKQVLALVPSQVETVVAGSISTGERGNVGEASSALHNGTVPVDMSLFSVPTFPPSPIYPLSHNQKALWFLSLLAPESTAYNLLYVARIQQRLDVSALQRSLHRLSARYPILTATYTLQNGEPVQQIHAHQTLPLEVIEATSSSLDELSLLLLEESDRPIDLTKGPVMRLQLYQRADDDYLLGFIFHHIVVDLWALELLIDELVLLYSTETTDLRVLPGQQGHEGLAEPNYQYADYVRWQKAMLDSSEGELHWQYWQNALAGDLPVLNLPTDRPRPPHQTYKGATQSFLLDTDLAKRLRRIANEEQVTLFTLMLTAYQVLLHCYSQQDDVLVGTPALGRTRSELERVIGYLANPVVVRARMGRHSTFKELLQQTKRNLLAALEHQDFPFPLLVERLQLRRDPSYSPIYQTLFIWDRPHTRRPAGQGQALSLRPFVYGQQGASFDITLTVFELDDVGAQDPHLRAEFRYNVDLFDASTIARMAEHFLTLLDGITNNLDQHIRELSLLPANVRQKLLTAWNATHSDHQGLTQDLCVHQLFERQVERTPDAVALVFGDEVLTYAELNRCTNQLAHHLREQGIGPDRLVGVCMERSIEMVISLLAVLKAGGAYMPLDPAYPRERLAWMLADAEVAIVLTDSDGADLLAASLAEGIGKTIDLDADWKLIATRRQENPQVSVAPLNQVYMIYTSGSTGKPKGTMNTHQGLCNRLLWMQETYQLTSRDRVLQKTPFSFDVSVWEFFWPLLTGASLILARPRGHHDPAYLKALIAEQAVSTLHFVPSMLQAFLEEQNLQGCESLRQVMCSGEVLSASLQARFFAHTTEEVKLHNLYGPTEAAIDVTFWECQRDLEALRLSVDGYNGVPIGRPIANTQIYLLDADLQPVPISIPGELYIGGVGLARGYFKQPDLTAVKFIPHPFPYASLGERLYRTGDLARYRADGAIEFLGRIDQQVKLRGFRIELGEIEATLQAHPAVQGVVVKLYEEERVGPYLAAYVVPAATPPEGQSLDPPPTREELQSYLRERLPPYMVPTIFVELQNLPLTPNGKVDRKALPIPERTAQRSNGYMAPQSELEQRISEIWREVLKIQEQIGIYENFFDLGGHSLLLIQVWSKLQAYLGDEMSVLDLFNYPTVHALSTHLSRRQEQELLLQPIVEQVQKRKAVLRRRQQRERSNE